MVWDAVKWIGGYIIFALIHQVWAHVANWPKHIWLDVGFGVLCIGWFSYLHRDYLKRPKREKKGSLSVLGRPMPTGPQPWEVIQDQLRRGIALMEHCNNDPTPLPTVEPEQWIRQADELLQQYAPKYLHKFRTPKHVEWQGGAIMMQDWADQKRDEFFHRLAGPLSQLREIYKMMVTRFPS